jgi:hypothetical protein
VLDLLTRWRSKVDTSAGPDGCWPWKAAVAAGYGTIRLGPRYLGMRGAHVVSHELFNGPVPKGLDVAHSCDNKLCVNPWHLSVQSKSRNTKDAVVRGQIKSGDMCARRVWPDATVRFVQESWLSGAEVSRLFGMSEQLVSMWRLNNTGRARRVRQS